MITKELSTRSMRWKNNARRPGCDQHLAGIARSIQQVDATPSRLDSSTVKNPSFAGCNHPSLPSYSPIQSIISQKLTSAVESMIELPEEHHACRLNAYGSCL